MKRTLLLVPLLLMACQKPEDSGGTSPSASLEEEFSLGVGQTMMLSEGQLTIKLLSVADDSRCPPGLRCVWGGNARVTLELNQKGHSPRRAQLNTAGLRKYPDTAKFLNYTIRLTDLLPQPSGGSPIAQSRYAATLVVSK